MIDSAKIYFHTTPKILDRLQDVSALDHIGLKLYDGKRFYLKHPFGPHYKNIPVWVNFDKQHMVLETSMAKFVQGHNVFGSNRAERLCFYVLKDIYRQLDVAFTADEKKLVKKKRIRLGRLDLTCSFRLNSQQEVWDILSLIFAQLKSNNSSWGAFGKNNIETVYNQPNSTRLTDKFYNKYQEILQHKIPLDVPERDRIVELSQKLVRFELTLRGKELSGNRGFGRYADEWTPSVVRQTIMARINKLNFQGSIKQSLQPSKIDGLKKGAQVFYDMWATGTDLSQHSQYSPIAKSRTAILKHNIDIFKPCDSIISLALNQILTADNAYFYAPKSLTRTNAVFR